MRLFIASIGLLLVLFVSINPLHADTIRVAAAASLSHALPEIVAQFERESGHRVKLTFGSSGNISRQIRQGAPFELFLSADELYVEQLSGNGFAQGESIVYARGYLALYAPNGSPVNVDEGFAGIADLLQRKKIRRFAIANPDHAPYGQLAKKVLQNAALWQLLQDGYLVTGESAAQTAQFAGTGAVDAALIPRSLAQLPALAKRGRSAALSESLSSPLLQRMLQLKGSGAAAQLFFEYLRSDAAQAVLIKHGFAGPTNN